MSNYMRRIASVFPIRLRAQLRGSARGYSLIELLVATAIVMILARLAVPVWTLIRQRGFDRAALSDVVNAGKALEAVDGTLTFSRTVVGPAAIPNLPGPRVSKGATLLVQRTKVGAKYNWYVRGKHGKGTITYYFQNGALTASKGKL
ncbi:MAG: type II secretion system protein [Deltaproteobacteria bacterium]|nr:type II secretion system protein [Deltaproteobacteria bacterium]